MNDIDVLTEHLERLGRTAPVPTTDPTDDVRRGRVALRRRRRWLACGAVGVVAAGAVAGVVLSAPGASVAHDPTDQTAARPTRHATPARAGAVERFCARQERSPLGGPLPWRDHAVAPTLVGYRSAAAEVLDPSGGHLDPTVSNVQVSCTRQQLQSLGTKLGWRGGAGLGDVQVEVAHLRPADLQVVMAHDGWTTDPDPLPSGVTAARTVDYPGGHAVVVERTDGLTVAVDAAGVWGNNAPAGSPAATDLPATTALLALAASPRLDLP